MNIQGACELLAQGDVVAFPTETVYGLGADATNVSAVNKVFALKKRPVDHPLIVHLADLNELSNWTTQDSADIQQLASAFWPGPLTLILKKQADVLDIVTGKQDTVGLRIPNHPLALELLKTYGRGLVAPSANLFGAISPTSAQAVRDEFGHGVACILDGGECAVGIESTILDLSRALPKILRPGMISAEAIEQVLNREIATESKSEIRVSGSHEKHYSPRTPTVLLSIEEIMDLAVSGGNYAFIVLTPSLGLSHTVQLSLNPVNYAHDIYRTLRLLDKNNYEKIIIQKVPETAEWAAIRDRLSRAAAS